MNGHIDNTFKVPNVSAALALFKEYYGSEAYNQGVNIGVNKNSEWG